MTSRFRRRRFVGPIVASAAIKGFLGRPLKSYRWLKKVDRPALRTALEALPFYLGDDPDSGEKRKPYMHQLTCAAIGSDLFDFLFFLDMGAGKTALTFHLYRWHRKFNGLKRLLVLTPRAVNVQSWLDDAEINAPDLKCLPLLGNADDRHRLVREKADIYLLPYPGLQTYMTSLQDVRTKKGKKKKRKRMIDEDMVKEFLRHFDGVVFDESHKIGNHMALVYHECRRFTRAYRFRYAMTGTPFGKDPIRLWAQFHVVDDGKTLGNSLGLFRAAFFNAKETPWATEYEFDKRMDTALRRMIQHRSIYYAEDEYADVRPVSRQRVRLNFTVSADEQYKAVLQRIRESHGEADELQSAYLRQRMVTSGFLSVKSEVGGRLTLEFEENPKLDMLEELLTNMPETAKAVVFHDYIFTGDMIGKRLTKIGLKYARLGGGATKDPADELRAFTRRADVRVLVANSESGGTGLNFQRAASYIMFYESPVDPITRKQAEKRVDRPGQKRRVFIYDLILKGSVDEKILRYLKDGRSLFDAICLGGKKAKEALL